MTDTITLPGSVHPLEILPVAGPPDHPEAYASLVLRDADITGPQRLRVIDRFAVKHDLYVLDDGGLTVKLTGTPAALASAFGVRLELVDHPRLGRFRRQVGPVQIPSELGDLVELVLGLDDRPVARPYNHGPYLPHTVPQPVTPLDLAVVYGFPAATGKGQTIGIIELGGALNAKDLASYLQQLNVTHTGTIAAVAVDGAKPVSDGPDGADGEVMLDVEVIAAIAPAADLRVYFAPNTDAGFVDAIAHAVSDGCEIISISWGGPEDAWTPASRAAMDKAFQAAITAGVTVLAAAGDNGSGDGERSGVHVDYPAASPYVTGCGGTRIVLNGGTFTETVWDDNPNSSATGGGYSQAYATPAWQAALGGFMGRGVPDVAGNADPQSGYRVLVDGQSFVIGGTSAVAPLWAGLIARVNELAGRPAGFINPKLYAGGQLRDITNGGNGAYKAAPGWDPCTGLGSPDGPKVMAALMPGASPVPPPSTPNPPAPGPDDADKALWTAARDWVQNHRHTGEAATVAKALKAWAAAEGLQ